MVYKCVKILAVLNIFDWELSMERSEQFWGKLISAEVILSLFGTILLVWGSYTVMADDLREQEVEIKEIKHEQVAINRAVQAIDTNIAIIRTEQAHLKGDLDEQKEDIKRIRQLLEGRYHPSSGAR